MNVFYYPRVKSLAHLSGEKQGAVHARNTSTITKLAREENPTKNNTKSSGCSSSAPSLFTSLLEALYQSDTCRPSCSNRD